MNTKNIIVVDMLEGFTRQGPLASPRINALVKPQAEFLKNLPKKSNIIFLSDEHWEGDFEFNRMPEHCVKGTDECSVRQELIQAAQGHTIKHLKKDQFSGFINSASELEETLSKMCGENNLEVIVIGCVTDCCIEVCVSDLTQREFDVTVIRELIDTWDMSEEQALEVGLTKAHAHPADEINKYFFEHRFPAIWGANVLDNWREVLQEKAAV